MRLHAKQIKLREYQIKEYLLPNIKDFSEIAPVEHALVRKNFKMKKIFDERLCFQWNLMKYQRREDSRTHKFDARNKEFSYLFRESFVNFNSDNILYF